MLQRLARACYRRRWAVLAGWVALLIGLTAVASVAAGSYHMEFDLPGSESQEAFDILQTKGFADRTGVQGQVVFRAPQGVNDPDVRRAMEELFARIQQEVPDTTVVSPYGPDGAQQISQDGTIAYAEVNLADRPVSEYETIAEQVKGYVAEVQVPGLQIELGGDAFATWQEPSSEVIGLLAAVVILLIAFGSLLAMGLPILTALFGIGCGVALVRLATNVVDIPDFTLQAAIMIGIGVGIDYALFIVTRYRQGLQEGLEPEGAVVRAVDTSGRAVLFAGTTVVISVLGLFAMNIGGLGVGIALGVLMTMLASVTLLPAVLGFVGRNIDRLGLPHRHQAEGQARRSIWYRWSRVVQRRPWPAALLGLAVLLVLAVPVLSLRLGFGDAGNRPTSDTTRRAYDLLSQGFGPGFNGPLLIAAETPGGAADLAALQRLSQVLNGTPGVAYASQPFPNEAGDAAIIQVVPTTAPQDEATTDLVHRLRNQVVPETLAGSSVDAKVGGFTAGGVDYADYTFRRLPVLMGAVLALSFLLLMTVFRSVLVPIKAVVMNLLSIGAAYGIVVAVFQWGWGANLVGVGREGPFEAWAPMILFAVVFGLSMDYEVFLLSRIREEYDRTGDNGRAVADGLAATARVITAAAAIMVAVFASFILFDERAIKIMGLGLAVAVLIDATIVRLVLATPVLSLRLGFGDAGNRPTSDT
ncbi:MAG TPA: MMPL family transporter, partial [Dehalococcoidia bacterium]